MHQCKQYHISWYWTWPKLIIIIIIILLLLEAMVIIIIIRALALHKTCGHQDHHYNHHHTHTNYATQRSPVKVHWKLHIGMYMIHTNPRMKEKQCPKGPSIASLQVASPYIHLSGWRKSWKEDQWTMRFWEERSINHIGLVQWSCVIFLLMICQHHHHANDMSTSSSCHWYVNIIIMLMIWEQATLS